LIVLALGCGASEGVSGGSGGEGLGGSAGTADLGAGGRGGSAGVSTVGGPSLPWPLVSFPELPPVASNVPEARIELGNLLFYDPVLSVDGETACGTCHSEFWGMSDALPLSVGHGAGLPSGPRREGPNVTRRNSLALINLAFRETFFWDGRTDSLEEQAIMPLLEESELNLDPDLAIELLAAIPEYIDRFAAAFPEQPEVTLDNLGAALAAFQRTIVSNRSQYDAYLRGHLGALDDELVEGMHRFAEMGCHTCHVPPLFESETFANRNVPAIDGTDDEGLAEVTGRVEDIGKFRTPSLRNITVTEPYFHNGSAPTLTDAVVHELTQTGLPFGDEDVWLIERFIDDALRDESRAAQRPKQVPSGLPVPLDGQFFPLL
jgi:cytochrome c peroxidase